MRNNNFLNHVLKRKPRVVINGIPRFVKNEFNFTGKVFGFEHKLFKNAKALSLSKDRVKDLLTDTQLNKEYFKNKIVLDAGCGSGRWSYALLKLGAKVIGVDISRGGVEVTNENLGKFKNFAVIQADIMDLPFKNNSFDFIFSWGVLHHTPKTFFAFKKLIPLLKPGGSLYIMVYEKNSPLRTTGTNVLRYFLRKMSDKERYQFCAKLIIRNGLLFVFLSHFLLLVNYEEAKKADIDLKQIQFGLYDAYSPRYNYQHTIKEVKSWFEKNNFREIELTKPIKYTKWLDIMANGQCGGAIHMRGIKVK